MTKPKGDDRLRLQRCASSPSTTTGGSSPQMTELAVSSFGDSLSPRSVIGVTNISKVSLREGMHIDEYFLNGGIDLGIALYDRMASVMGSIKLVFRVPPNEPETHPGLSVLSIQHSWQGDTKRWLAVSLVENLHFVSSHHRDCGCTTCQWCIQYLLDKSLSGASLTQTKVGRFEHVGQVDLSTPLIISHPGLRVRVTREFGDFRRGISVSFDCLTKYINANFDAQPSVFDVLVSKKFISQLVNQYVVTSYNPKKIYRVKCIRYDISPMDTFFNKRINRNVSYWDHVLKVYHTSGQFHSFDSPMIEVYPENHSETCFLIPAFTYLIKPIKERLAVPMQTIHAQTRIGSNERKLCIDTLVPQDGGLLDICPLNVLCEVNVMKNMGGMCPTGCDPMTTLPPWGVIVEGSVTNCILGFINELVAGSHGRIPRPNYVVADSDYERGDVPSSVSFLLIIIKHRSGYARWKWTCFADKGIGCQIVRLETVLKNKRDAREDLGGQMLEKVRRVDNGEQDVYALDFHRFGDLCVLSVFANGEVVYDLKHICGDVMSDEEMASIYAGMVGKLARPSHPPIVMFASRRRIPGQNDFDLISSISSQLKNIFEKFVFVNCSTRTDTRIFLENGSSRFAVQTQYDTGQKLLDAFYLVPHVTVYGNALPLHFTLVDDLVGMGIRDVMRIVVSMYRDGPENMARMPNPFVHTLKISELIGVHLKKCAGNEKTNKFIHKINSSLGWQYLLNRGTPFYL